MLSVVNLSFYSFHTVIEYFDWLVQQMLVCSEMENVHSAFFKVNSGVWQDGVLSLMLFAVYIDGILCKLMIAS